MEKKTEKVEKKKFVLVETENLNIRSGAGFQHESRGFVNPGRYEVTDENNGFYRLASDKGWICAACVKCI